MIIQAGEFWVADILFTSGEGSKKRSIQSKLLLGSTSFHPTYCSDFDRIRNDKRFQALIH